LAADGNARLDRQHQDGVEQQQCSAAGVLLLLPA